MFENKTPQEKLKKEQKKKSSKQYKILDMFTKQNRSLILNIDIM